MTDNERKSVRSACCVALGLSLVSTAWGCNRSARQSPTQAHDSSVVHADSRTSRSAVRSIAEARCERDDRCGNIGVDEKYASKSACLERAQADWADELNARECPAGVRSDELDECLSDIKGEECGSPLDSLTRMLSCSATEICSDDPS